MQQSFSDRGDPSLLRLLEVLLGAEPSAAYLSLLQVCSQGAGSSADGSSIGQGHRPHWVAQGEAEVGFVGGQVKTGQDGSCPERLGADRDQHLLLCRGLAAYLGRHFI